MPGIMDEILGLGYSGYARLGTHFILLEPSTVEEQDNLTQSEMATATTVSLASGKVPYRERRHLDISIKTPLTRESWLVFREAFLDWRNGNFLAPVAHTARIVLANEEGYDCAEIYWDTASIGCQEGENISLDLSGKCFRWTDLNGTPTPQYQAAFVPFYDPAYQPIPHWNSTVAHSGVYGTILAYDLSFNNQWRFLSLNEATPGPPTPRVVHAGALLTEMSVTELASYAQRPAEYGDVTIQFGVGFGGMVSITPFSLRLPFVYRYPSRQGVGLGEGNRPIQWQSRWYLLRSVPIPG